MPFAADRRLQADQRDVGASVTLGTSGRVVLKSPAERGLGGQHEGSEDDVGEHRVFPSGEEQQLRMAVLRSGPENSVTGACSVTMPRRRGPRADRGAASHQRVGGAAGESVRFELGGPAGFQAEVARGDAEPGGAAVRTSVTGEGARPAGRRDRKADADRRAGAEALGRERWRSASPCAPGRAAAASVAWLAASAGAGVATQTQQERGDRHRPHS